MAQSKFFNIVKRFLFLVLILFQILLLISNSSYAIYEDARDSVSYDSGSKTCDLGSIPYDPFVSNVDFEWVFSNPTCAAFTAGTGATILALQLASYLACRPSLFYGYNETYEKSIEAALTANATLGPWTVAVLGHLATQCTKRTIEYSSLQSLTAAQCIPPATAQCPVYQGHSAAAATVASVCCVTVASHLAAVGVGLGILAVTWELADNAFQKDRICGHNWNEWQKDNKGDWKRVKGDRAQCISDLFLLDGVDKDNRPDSCQGLVVDGSEVGKSNSHYDRDIKNRFYREFIYGGVEYEDNGDGACQNPHKFSSASRKDVLGYDSNRQRYYMTGPASTASFACRRFVDTNPTPETEAAYQCCKKRSQNVICLEGKPYDPINTGLAEYEHKICEVGKSCEVAGIFYSVYESKSVSSHVCAETYSVCPYDHLLAGGTEVREFKEDSDGNLVTKNFCQYLNHCQKLPITPYVRSSTIDGDFISQTCKDMKGDSQNVYSYNLHIAGIRLDGFTSPIAQCYKETIENVFLNRAGHSVCLDPDEFPTKDGKCKSGYKLKKGEELPNKSFFIQIQDSVRDYVKLTLIFAVMAFGIGILLAAPNEGVSKKKILPFIVKIGLVTYFAIGSAWQDNFVDGALQTSTLLGDMVFSIDESTNENKLDGCQFPRFDYANDNEKTRYDDPQYAPEHQYLRIWDTLDCKIARALGYGPDVSVPNLIFMILGGFLVSGLGVIFFLATFFLAFLLLSIAVRALQIFLISITVVVLLLYVSPIIIPLCLFEKTKNIFTNWWKQLVGFILQPMILFVYLGILISVIDVTIVGDVKFEGDGKTAPKKIVCEGESKNKSIYCIFNVADIKTFTGLEPIGIGLPVLASMNQQKLQFIIKSAIVLFIFFQFLDQIMVFAKKLVGGGSIKSSWDVKGAASKAAGVLKGVQERGTRAIGKHGSNALRKGYEAGKDFAEAAGQKRSAKASEVASTSGSDDKADTDRGGGKEGSVDEARSQKNSDSANKSTAKSNSNSESNSNNNESPNPPKNS